MKLVSLLLMIGCLSASAGTKAQHISLSVRNEPFENVIKEIARQSGYQFFYNQAIIKDAKNLTVDIKGLTLENALGICFREQPFSYAIVDKIIVVKQRSGAENKIGTVNPENGLILSEPVKGRVVTEEGKPLEGVTVAIKGSSKGVATDNNGMFTINASKGDVLRVSSIGYETKEIRIGDASTFVEIVLTTKPQENEAVVVTALGIKRSVKALTYDAQEIKGEELTRNKDANFVNSLTGKIAGVTINASSSGVGGATRVVMRGTKSINGSNGVLYVVDGIPLPVFNGGSSSGAFDGAVSGEGISSFNPEDIESITALTGPSATALYGSDGARGVILITTKKGNPGKLSVSFNHSTDFFSPFVLPQFQNTYGNVPGQMQSWGNKLDTPSTYNPKDFFQRGFNSASSISLSGGTEKSQTYVSIGANNAEGIVPNNTYSRYNFSLHQSTRFTDRLKADFNAMYVKTNENNMIAQGQYNNPIVGAYLFSPGEDIDNYKVYERYDPLRRIPLQFWPFGNQGLSIQNPYWVTYAQSDQNVVDRFMLSVTALYNINSWIDITGRVRMDKSYFTREEKRPAGTDGVLASVNGFYQISNSTLKSNYADAMVSMHHKITDAINFRSIVGTSYSEVLGTSVTDGGRLNLLANFYALPNTPSTIPRQSQGPAKHAQLPSLFATADIDYKNWLYLSLTGRKEWNAALAGANRKSYIYPSVGVSAILSDALHLPKHIISFAKLRASYAEVGNAPLPGITNPTYSLTSGAFAPAPLAEFQPERTASYEMGLELKFLKNTLSLNATVYQSNTYHQLLSYEPGNPGLYTVFYYNAGNIENKGIEASLGYKNKFGAVIWSTNFIYTLNRNTVKRLSEGSINPVTKEVFGAGSIIKKTAGDDLLNILTVGGSMSDLYITQLLREDNQGKLWTSGAGGIAKIYVPARYIGRTTPDYNISWRNSFSYKNFDFSWLIDARVGGIGISYTQSIMDFYGVSKKSADERDKGSVDVYNGVYPDIKQFYSLLGSASGASVGMAAYYVYDATNVRLREAALGYTLPGSLCHGKIKGMRIGINGRNLFMFYNKSPFDPESTSSTDTYYQGIDYFRPPSFRSYGASVKVQF